MTADVGLDVYLCYDHRGNLEDVRALARLSPGRVDKGQRATSYMAESGPARGSP